MSNERSQSAITLLLLASLVPIILVYVLAANQIAVPSFLLPVILLICCVAMFCLSVGCGRRAEANPDRWQTARVGGPTDSESADVGELRDFTSFRPASRRTYGKSSVIEGELAADPDAAYAALRERFAPTDTVPLLQEGESGQPRVVLLPREALEPRGRNPNPAVNLVLFLATMLTTTWAGALHEGVNLLQEPGRFAVGLPYSLALMVILGAHELGHYFTARRHGMKVTLPYFIPVPFALGTFGAFIRLRSLAPNRRALFDVAVAGPFAGLIVAIPALFFGLQHSQVIAASGDGIPSAGTSIGSSMLLALIAQLALGESLAEGQVLMLHPVAFAGWLGLIVTALNLLPIGQLDGGHMADAMFGQRISTAISTLAIVGLFALGLFVWSGLLTWALIVYFIAGRKGMPPLNNVTKLDAGRMVVGWLGFLILIAILMPMPHRLLDALGIQCPYL